MSVILGGLVFDGACFVALPKSLNKHKDQFRPPCGILALCLFRRQDHPRSSFHTYPLDSCTGFIYPCCITILCAGNLKILELDYPNLVLIFNSFILVLHLLRILLHLLSRPMPTTLSANISRSPEKKQSQSRSPSWLTPVGDGCLF